MSNAESDILFRQGSTVNEEFQSKLIDAINSGKTLVGYYLTGTGGYGTYDFARLITGRIQSVGTMNVLTLFFLKE
ncbi:MAG: hypothetical protein LBJ17_03915, partial [Dysgonamonadaceae bacterium]|nr:hypothetical protein [Dysgonamonadaceae bacterium]